MEIVKATPSDKEKVLSMLDDFRTNCMAVICPEKKAVSTSSKERGGPVFDNVLESNDFVILLAKEKDQYLGLVTAILIPQIRNGEYIAEIEELYVVPDHQRKGIGKELIDSVIEWAKTKDSRSIRLESSNELKESHIFYEKSGFRKYGKAFIRYFK